MHLSARTTAAVTVISALSLACEQSGMPPLDTVPAGGTAGAMGNGGGASVAELPPFGGAPPLPPVEARAPSEAATCEPELCSVASAWDVLDPGAGGYNDLRLATSADTTYVVMASHDSSNALRPQRLIALDATGALAIDQGPVPQQLRSWVAIGTDGELRVVGALPAPTGSPVNPPVEEDILSGSAWRRSAIEASELADGFEVDPGNRSRVLVVDGALDRSVATRETDGRWTNAPLSPAAVGTFALDASGAPAFVSLGRTELVAVDAAGATFSRQALPESVANDGIASFAVGREQPLAVSSQGTDLGIALLLDDGLHVFLADRARGTMVDVPVPNTQVPGFDCREHVMGTQTSECVYTCPNTCTFEGRGLAPGGSFAPALSKAFALGRTADGAFWLGYVISELVIDYEYTLGGGEAGCQGCNDCRDCFARDTVRSSSSTLRVARIAADGSSVRDALTAPVGELLAPSYFTSAEANGVQIRAFGQHVAVAVAHVTPADEVGLLVMTFDASVL